MPSRPKPQPSEGSNESRQHLFEKGNLDHQVMEQAVSLSIEKPEDLEPLAVLNELRHLDLSANQVNGLSPLAGLKDLVVVSLADNPITRALADQLQKALPKCEVKHNLQP